MKYADISLVSIFCLILSATAFEDNNCLSKNDTACDSLETKAPDKVLSRRKRYLTFPKDSTLQFLFCLTIPVLAPYSYAFGYTLSAAYILPDDAKMFLLHASEIALHRRDRRDLFPRIETFLEANGMDGRQCVLRAICEAKAKKNKKGEFLEELIHALFRFREIEDPNEDEPIHYDDAFQVTANCTELFPGCVKSLFEYALL